MIARWAVLFRFNTSIWLTDFNELIDKDWQPNTSKLSSCLEKRKQDEADKPGIQTISKSPWAKQNSCRHFHAIEA